MKIERVKEFVKNVIIILVILLVFKSILSYQLARSEKESYEYTVMKSDTLWTIAANICDENEGLNIRNVISDIKELNNISSSTIYTGQTIKLPIY